MTEPRTFVRRPRAKGGSMWLLADQAEAIHTPRTLRLTPAGERVAFEQALERLMALPPPWLT